METPIPSRHSLDQSSYNVAPTRARSHSRQASGLAERDAPLNRAISYTAIAVMNTTPHVSPNRAALTNDARQPELGPSPTFMRERSTYPKPMAVAPKLGAPSAGPAQAGSQDAFETQRRVHPAQAPFAREHRSANGVPQRSLHQSPPRNQHPVTLDTVQSFAIEHLFSLFLVQANKKNEHIAGSQLLNSEPHIEGVCGQGADPAFDQLLSAMGRLVRENPKPLVDRIVAWRAQYKNATFVDPATSVDRSLPVSATGTTSNQESTTSFAPSDALANNLKRVPPSSTVHLQTELQLSTATYLACRCLIEVFAQTTLNSLSTELLNRIEEMIFVAQFEDAGRDDAEKSALKVAKSNIGSQLLGVLARLDFTGVAMRFLNEFKKLQPVLGTKGNTNRVAEAQLAHFSRSLRYMRLPCGSENAWGQSSAFMHSVSELFAGVHGQATKLSYSRLIGNILLPLAPNVATNFDQSVWKKAVHTMGERLAQLAAKPKYWQTAYPVMVTLACVSPYDVLMSKYHYLVGMLPTKLRERNNRATALKSTCRLVWSYLQRTNESYTVVAKNLEDLAQKVFFSGKRYSLSSEPAIAEPLIHLIRIIGHRYHDVCFRSIIFPLVNAELLATIRDPRELKVDQLDPDKTVIGIRAFIAVSGDLETDEFPVFPIKFEDEWFDETSWARTSNSTKLKTPIRKVSLVRGERLSKPVMTTRFSASMKEHHSRFCDMLSTITIACDYAFGGQAAMEERLPNQPPKTPIADSWSFSRREESFGVSDERHGFYDLLHVAVQALPRCLSKNTPINQILSLLCSGTAHINRELAASSGKSLRSIALQGHAHQVVLRFSSFIHNYDVRRHWTLADGGILGPNHIDETLNFYVELLKMWISELQEKNAKGGSVQVEESSIGRPAQAESAAATWNQVDRVEAQGFLFLCSPSHRTRAIALKLLGLVTELDAALGTTNTRIATVLENNSKTILDIPEERLSQVEKWQVDQALRDSKPYNTFVDLCSHNTGSTLWPAIFPNMIRNIFDACLVAVTQTREDVCARLSQLHSIVEGIEDRPRVPTTSTSFDSTSGRLGVTLYPTHHEMLIEQWKYYLIFACATITKTSGSSQIPPAQDPSHTRKTSRSSQSTQDSFSTAVDLFAKVTPMLSASAAAIRSAAVIGLGSVNATLYKTLLETLDAAVRNQREDTRKMIAAHNRTASSPRRATMSDYFTTEVAHVYKLTSHYLQLEAVLEDVTIMDQISAYTQDLKRILSTVESDQNYMALRLHYCGLVESFYAGINKTSDSQRWMSFQTRRAAFMLMEQWCWFSSQSSTADDNMNIMNNMNNMSNTNNLNANRKLAGERKALTTAALSAMASLCAGPLRIKAQLEFNVSRMLGWIDDIFNTEADRWHAIGQRALKNLVQHNPKNAVLIEKSIDMLYLAKTAKALASYVDVVVDIFMQEQTPEVQFWKVLSALLFTLGNDRQHVVRMKAARLLRVLDDRQRRKSKLRDLDVSISGRTTVVNKKAQFEISQRLANDYSDNAFHVFNEFSRHFKHLRADHQRSMVSALLPWVKSMRLATDPSGKPNGHSFMLLLNLLDITLSCSSTLHHEIPALWQALATGPHQGNVAIAVDFIIDLSLDRKNMKVVTTTGQIVVFLSTTPAGQSIIQLLLDRITPGQMVIDKLLNPIIAPQDAKALYFLADPSSATQDSGKQHGLSMGQLCLILLVDLIVAPVTLPMEKIPQLIQGVMVLWDHHMEVVQEQAREMLVHLIHELVLSKLPDSASPPELPAIESFLELIRQHDAKVTWKYDDNDGKRSEYKLPDSMAFVVEQVVKIFSIGYPRFESMWGRTTIDWATQCPVRHLACRSLQIYRCILTPTDQEALSDLTARFHLTLSDDEEDIQMYALELMRAFRAILEKTDLSDERIYAELFWIVYVCLTSVHESEFIEAISMLETCISKLDLGDPMIQKILLDQRPDRLTVQHSLTDLVYRGCRSGSSIEKCLALLDLLVRIPANALVGNDDRLLYTLLANMPSFAHSIETAADKLHCDAAAATLARASSAQGCDEVTMVLERFAISQFASPQSFISEALAAVKKHFFPRLEAASLKFLMGLLTNSILWIKTQALQMIGVMVQDFDIRRPDIIALGPDLVSPLLGLLQTKLGTQALGVLDGLKKMPGAPLGQQVLNMGLSGGPMDRLTKREYGRTPSLYGLPELSGWSIPMPTIQKESAREGLEIIYKAFTDMEVVGSSTLPTPEVEFYPEESQQSSYFSERSITAVADESSLASATMGLLVDKLDELDDWLDDPTFTGQDSFVSSSTMTSASLSRQTTVESQTTNASRPSYSRNDSMGSIHNHSSPRPTHQATSRDPPVMSPSAFTFSASPKRNNTRPGIGHRSITSNAVVQRTPPDRSFPFASASETSEPFSDDDLLTGRTSISDVDGSFNIEISNGTVRPSNMQRTRSSFRNVARSGFKRLTGSSEKPRPQRSVAGSGSLNYADSPEVPRVPDVYRSNDPRTSDL